MEPDANRNRRHRKKSTIQRANRRDRAAARAAATTTTQPHNISPSMVPEVGPSVPEAPATWPATFVLDADAEEGRFDTSSNEGSGASSLDGSAAMGTPSLRAEETEIGKAVPDIGLDSATRNDWHRAKAAKGKGKERAEDEDVTFPRKTSRAVEMKRAENDDLALEDFIAEMDAVKEKSRPEVHARIGESSRQAAQHPAGDGMESIELEPSRHQREVIIEEDWEDVRITSDIEQGAMRQDGPGNIETDWEEISQRDVDDAMSVKWIKSVFKKG